MDPGTSEEDTDAAHGVRSHEEHWTLGGRGDFAGLQGYCCWFRMNVHGTKFAKHCLGHDG